MKRERRAVLSRPLRVRLLTLSMREQQRSQTGVKHRGGRALRLTRAMADHEPARMEDWLMILCPAYQKYDVIPASMPPFLTGAAAAAAASAFFLAACCAW